MTAHKHLDFRKALANPRSEFGNPERLLADPRLDREGKRAILRTWQQDERELDVAEKEGMGDGERSMLRRVVAALDSISGRVVPSVRAGPQGAGPAASKSMPSSRNSRDKPPFGVAISDSFRLYRDPPSNK